MRAMPVYLFTFHAYGTWMPDRARGYVRPKRGILAADPAMAARYRSRAKHPPAAFGAPQQQLMIETLLEAAKHLGCDLRAVATDATHLHVLVSWGGARMWQQNRTSLKRALTIALKREYGGRAWLTENASRKRVKDREHYDYLTGAYLPSHRGCKWSAPRGMYR